MGVGLGECRKRGRCDGHALACLQECVRGFSLVSGQGSTALTWASEKGHLEIVLVLLDRGASIDHATNEGSLTRAYTRHRHAFPCLLARLCPTLARLGREWVWAQYETNSAM